MSTTLLSIKTDEETKRELKKFAAELGVSSTAVVNMAVRQVLQTRRIELEPTLEPSPYLEKIMREADKDIKNGKNISKGYDNVDDFFADLEKDIE